MRIGILTFHRANNYGAQLQCYALCRALSNLGHNAEVIDYRQPVIEKSYCKVGLKDFNPLRPVRFLKSLFLPQTLTRNIRHCRFVSFRNKYINCSEKIFTPDNKVIEEYDVIFIGSDQLWNSKWTNGLDDYYWGNFRHPVNTVIASYAVSIGKTDIDEEEKEKIKQLLDNFDFLSVRENSLKSLINNLSNKDVKVTIDPTFLLSKEEWMKFVKPEKKKYVLIYPLIHTEETISIGKQIAKENNMDYVIIDFQSHWKPIKNHKQFEDPATFLNLIANAEYVVTSSFHGTAFSVIFEKQFYSVVARGAINTRISSLLNTLGLENRIISIEDFPLTMESIVYNELNEEKSQLVNQSMNFIYEVINSASLIK